MSNPNNCNACDHKNKPDGGHCYMFKLEPTKPCAHHTIRALAARATIQQALSKLGNGAKP
jgi:hypothetical protein